MFVCIWSYAITAAHFASLNDHFFGGKDVH